MSSGVDAPVLDLLSFDDGSGPALYAAGMVCLAGGDEAALVARLRDGTWEPLNLPIVQSLPLGNRVNALTVGDIGSGPSSFAEGRFLAPGGEGIARWDGVRWIGIGFGMYDPYEYVEALHVADLGGGPRLYLGGRFYGLAQIPGLNNVASWNGSAWAAFPTASGIGTNGPVLAITSCDLGSGPRLYIAGEFLAPASRIAE